MMMSLLYQLIAVIIIPLAPIREYYVNESAALPAVGKDWDRLGTFRIQDRAGVLVTVILYSEDSDSVAEKRFRKGESVVKRYPNLFSIHAVYRSGKGKWAKTELVSASRVGFSKVLKESVDSVTLQLQPRVRIDRRPGEDLMTTLDRAEQVNRPFVRTISIVDGVPVLK